MISFLQSDEWEKFQQSFGRKSWRVKGILIIKHDLPFGFSYLYCPRPNLNESEWDKFLTAARETATAHNCIFLKIEPEAGNFGFFGKLGFVRSKKEIQPSRTLILDLSKNEEELLAGMHQKTRYNIRLAERHGVKIRELNHVTKEDFQKIWPMLQATSRRDGFSLHSKKYYGLMIAVLAPAGILKIFGGFLDDKIIAVSFMIFHGETVTYLHGASDYDYRNLMAPFALHWHIIKEAKSNGYSIYDFWGVSERYPGVSRFKEGFGGKEITYPGSFDYIFNPLWYNIYRAFSKIRRH